MKPMELQLEAYLVYLAQVLTADYSSYHACLQFAADSVYSNRLFASTMLYCNLKRSLPHHVPQIRWCAQPIMPASRLTLFNVDRLSACVNQPKGWHVWRQNSALYPAVGGQLPLHPTLGVDLLYSAAKCIESTAQSYSIVVVTHPL